MGVVFVVVGTETERTLVLGLGLIELVLLGPKRSKGEYFGVAFSVMVEGFMGVPSTALPFLDGEKRMFGSTFSVSKSSSNGSRDNRRFIGVFSWPLMGEVMLDWDEIAIPSC